MSTPMSGSPRAHQPADRWEIDRWDPENPWQATLVLSAADGPSLALPFDDDLLAACQAVARAWYGNTDAVDDHPGDETINDEDDDEDDPEVFRTVSQVTGWRQVTALWDGLAPEQRTLLLMALVALLVLAAFITQFT